MDRTISKIISAVFYVYFFLLPLVLYPKTSEIFEFNKMVLTYAASAILAGMWIIRMIAIKKIVFKKSLLDIPIAIFLLSQFLASIFSIDLHSSVYGYYSRFNGGFLSVISFSLLYFIFVSNMDRERTIKSIYVLLISTMLASIWAIFEHFGHSFSCLIFPDFGVFDVSCWVQDVKTRVYASFGQPNWLAAWLTALIPISWGFAISNLEFTVSNKNKCLRLILNKLTIFMFISIVAFITLLFTKSRSGILAFAISYIIFWGVVLLKQKENLKSRLSPFFLVTFFLSLCAFLIGTPWTPKLSALISPNSPNINIKTNIPAGPALETGGTESGIIRKIVWEGAVDVWKKYPVFGSGVETFAFSYYGSRPKEHNLVSEWDFLYNKAHNEYLNYASTTGTVGLLSYLFLIASSILLFFKISKKSSDLVIIPALLAGYVSILVTNFFGFSVVSVSLLFFLLPAFAITLTEQRTNDKGQNINISDRDTFSITQKIFFFFVLCSMFFVLSRVSGYWFSDLTYAKGKLEYNSGNYQMSLKTLSDLVKTSKNEPVYWDELADVTSAIANSEFQNNSTDNAKEFAKSALLYSNYAISLSPADVNIKRKAASRLLSLMVIDPTFILAARNLLEAAIIQAPTDAKLFFNLGLSYLRTGEYEKAIKTMEKTIELKDNYEKARYALALMYEDTKQTQKAKDQLLYILNKINPNSEEAKRALNEL